ncbi:MarR family winged helix-turn-helix transcriptional regulator [Gorillibacterium sp. CAU 1737]|uniref:MarR family winged helix-turn-helix transcriptional regulator n=1 Tax=Gorillibacterium sp. CAU 1737 TaxID=3140362 RepID=UPI00326162E8
MTAPSHFPPQQDSISRLLSKIHRHQQKQLVKKFQPYGLGGGHQYIFLINVLKMPGVNQDRLTCDLKFDKATTARSIKQLEEAGYIDRQPDPHDGRAYRLYPTVKAIEFEPTLRDLLMQENRKLVRALSEEEEMQLINLLQILDHSCEEADG